MRASRQIAGYRPWYPLQTTEKQNDIPWGHIPVTYLPANKAWIKGYAIHQQLRPPWSSWKDPLSAVIVGAATGTISGALAGMAEAAILFQEKRYCEWGIGSERLPATLGYCVGDLFKENTYFRYTVARPTPEFNAPLIYTTAIDVFQRSRLKRIYVQHGLITSIQVDKDNDKIIIQLDHNIPINSTVSINSNNGITIGDNSISTIKIIKDTGVERDYSIQKMDKFYSVELKLSDFQNIESYPLVGDFYSFEKAICTEDPYLISGKWLGTEGDQNTPLDTSEYKLYVTDHIQPYVKGSFTGAYVYQVNTESTFTTNTVDTSDNTSDNLSVHISPDTPFALDDENVWKWIPLEVDKSDIYLYGDINSRYLPRTSILDSSAQLSGSNVAVEMMYSLQFPEGTTGDIDDWIENEKYKDLGYIRLELSRAAHSGRQNFHAPILKKCWLKQDDKYFKILGQPEGNIIDVAIRDVSNTTSINYNKDYSILNQYAWMITEHFSDNSAGYALRIAEGKITNNTLQTDSATRESNTSVTTTSDYVSYGTVYSMHNSSYPSSFWDRFTTTFSPSDSEGNESDNNPLQAWKKYQNWKFCTGSGNSRTVLGKTNTFDIDPSSLVFPGKPTPNSQQYSISFKVKGDASQYSSGFISFDDPFETTFNAYLVYATINQGIELGNPELAVDMEYRSSLINAKIPKNTIVGACGGWLWGIEGSGSQFHVLSNNGVNLWVTVKSSSNGLVALMHRLTKEEIIFYKDSINDTMTIRMGCVNFRDMPRKIEVVFGNSVANSFSSTFPVTLDATRERVRSIEFDLPNLENQSSGNSSLINTDDFKNYAVTFQVGSSNNYYGPEITVEKGTIDLVPLEYAVASVASISKEDFMSNGKYISPIFLWKKNKGNNSNQRGYLEIGIPTTEKMIYAKNAADARNVTVSYIANSQVIFDAGNFYAFTLNDGRTLLVYDKALYSFKVNGNNPIDISTNNWGSQSGIFLANTDNNAVKWTCPFVSSAEANDKYQNPTMIIYGCSLESALYNNHNGCLEMLIRGYDKDGFVFLARYSLQVIMTPLEDSQILLCDIQTQGNTGHFLYRQPQMRKYIWEDDESFISKDQFISYNGILGFDNVPEGEYKSFSSDEFVKILGNSNASSMIIAGSNFNFDNICSMHILKTGHFIILAPDDKGIRLFYSNGGDSWKKSAIILTESAYSAYLLDDLLFYVDATGLKMRKNMLGYIYSAMQTEEISPYGITTTTTSSGLSQNEIDSLQNNINNTLPTLITTVINGEGNRITAYRYVDGRTNVAFYDSSGVVNCYTSTNLEKWTVYNNF